jgi:hypothetical protein
VFSASPRGEPFAAPIAPRASPSRAPGNLAALFFLLIAGVTALSIDIARTADGVKGDEATYVAMALSAAFDGDLEYERRDLQRFYTIYNDGPEGIFLKAGRSIDIDVGGSFPFVHVAYGPDPRLDRLYYGKAAAYSVAAAPFVRAAGINGLLFFNVLLLVTTFLVAYHFLAARASATAAVVTAVGLLGATVAPLYVVWLTSEIFNLALVAYAYFLWLYKYVAAPASGWWAGFLRSRWSDIVAMVLLGIAGYSKLLPLALVGPIVVSYFWRREWWRATGLGTVAALTTAMAFAANLAVTGDWNFQGGGENRKTCYSSFPFDAPDANFSNRCSPYATDSVTTGFGDDAGTATTVLLDNAWYFVFGRYTGLLPYYLPTFTTLACCVMARRRVLLQQWLTLAAIGIAIVVMLIWLPYTWGGGGGAPGNRYFLCLYPALFFVMPPLTSIAAGVVSWAGLVFVAPLLVNPYFSSDHPWQAGSSGVFRWLPIELTMMNDLPVMVDPGRGHVVFGESPRILLYFMDDEAWPTEEGFWVAGAADAEIVVRAGERLHGLTLTIHSPQPNVVHFDAGAGNQSLTLARGETTKLFLPATSRISRGGFAFVLRARTERGFVPRLEDPASGDERFLGVDVKIAGVRTP